MWEVDDAKVRFHAEPNEFFQNRIFGINDSCKEQYTKNKILHIIRKLRWKFQADLGTWGKENGGSAAIY